MPGPNSPYTSLDSNQVIQRVFEESQDRLRVDAQVTATLGTVECIVSAASGDNIAITSQDGTKTLAVNTNGSINAEPAPFSSFKATQVSVGISATRLDPTPLTNRKNVKIKITLNGNVAVYIGESSGVTTATGYYLANDEWIEIPVSETQEIWAIASGDAPIAYVMEFA